MSSLGYHVIHFFLLLLYQQVIVTRLMAYFETHFPLFSIKNKCSQSWSKRHIKQTPNKWKLGLIKSDLFEIQLGHSGGGTGENVILGASPYHFTIFLTTLYIFYTFCTSTFTLVVEMFIWHQNVFSIKRWESRFKTSCDRASRVICMRS